MSKLDNAAQILLGIINDILDFSKMEAGKLRLEQVEFNPQSLFDNLVILIGQKAQDKGLELLFRIDPALPDRLIGDPLRICQVLTNFCSNAVKFTERGEIEVSVKLLERTGASTSLRFAVRDTGIGITPEQLGRLFQAFEQADTSTTRKYGGTGLGLTISKRLAELMQGTVGVESEPGKGSTFWFTLAAAVPQSAGDHQIPGANEIAGRRVLVVDDNVTAREILGSLAASLSLDVTLATSGAEALALLQGANDTAPFELVLMDWQMPVLSGADAARMIRAEPGLRQPRIVMVTAFGREDVQQRFVDIAVDGLLIKPVSRSALLNTLTGLLCEARDSNSQRITPAAAAPNLSGLRALVVDDHALNREVAVEILAKAGISSDIAENGKQALAKLRETHFDLVLMDMQMPELDGLAATAEIRRNPEWHALPIIAMTANVAGEQVERCLSAGMQDHVAKPISVKELYAKISRHVALPHNISLSTPPDTPIALAENGLPPAIEGVDLEAGLRVMGGDAALYRRMLLKFRESQVDAALRIANALANGDRDAALREAHTLKGVAGNIGARAVYGLACDVEVLLKLEFGDPGIQLAELHALLTQVGMAIGQLRSWHDAKPDHNHQHNGSAERLGLEVLKPLLKQLQARLADDDTSAAELLEDIAETLHGQASEQVGAIARALDEYDFEAAQLQLWRLNEVLAAAVNE